MTAFRMSVSDLEACRWWGMTDGVNTRALLDRLNTPVEPTPEMLLGTKVHWLMEAIGKGPDDGITFIRRYDPNGRRHIDLIDGTREEDELQILKPDAVELPIYQEFEVDGEPLLVSSRVDAIAGRTVVDYKVTTKALAMRWYDSWQWRLYLMLVPDAIRFRYQALRVKEDETGSVITIQDAAGFEIDRPARLEEDTLAAITPYVRWLRRKGWTKGYRRGRQAA